MISQELLSKNASYSVSEITMRCKNGIGVESVHNYLRTRGFEHVGERRKKNIGAGERLYDAKALMAAVKHFDSKEIEVSPSDCLGVTEIAKKLVLTPQSVRRRISNLHLEPATYDIRSNNKVRLYSPDQIEKIRKYSRARHRHINISRRSKNEFTVREIANKLHVSPQAVNGVIGILRIPSVGRFVRNAGAEEINTYSKQGVAKIEERIRERHICQSSQIAQ